MSDAQVPNLNLTVGFIKGFSISSDFLYFVLLLIYVIPCFGDDWSYFDYITSLTTCVSAFALFVRIIADFCSFCCTRWETNTNGVYVGRSRFTFWIVCQVLITLIEIPRLVFATLGTSHLGSPYRPYNEQFEYSKYRGRLDCYSRAMVTLLFGYPLLIIRCWFIILIYNFRRFVQPAPAPEPSKVPFRPRKDNQGANRNRGLQQKSNPVVEIRKSASAPAVITVQQSTSFPPAPPPV